MEQTIQAGTVTAICISEKRGTQENQCIQRNFARTGGSRAMCMPVTDTAK